MKARSLPLKPWTESGMVVSANPLWGILGGMGPLASAELVQRVYRSWQGQGPEQDMPRLLLMSDPLIPDRTDAHFSSKVSELRLELEDRIDKLIAAGADILVVTCITAHAFLPDASRCRIPLLSLVDVTLNELRFRAGRYLLLASSGSIAAGLFGPPTINLIQPDPSEQDLLHNHIYDLKKTGDAANLASYIQYLAAQKDCNGVVAGCTEVGLARRLLAEDLEVIDPMDRLVDLVVANHVAVAVQFGG